MTSQTDLPSTLNPADTIHQEIKHDTASLFFDSTRDTYARTLIELIEEGYPIVVVDADLMKSAGTSPVLDRFPDRVIQVGIAEQNLVGVASGLAEMGLIPFADTFAVLFSRRAADQVWMAVAFSNMNVKMNGLYSGFTTGTNGPTHQSLEDVAIMRTFPNMVIMEPADCSEIRMMVRAAAKYVGPVYLRTVRGDMPPLVSPAEIPFEIGKAVTLRPGDDAAIIASGVMVQQALKASETLAKQGIVARVVNVRTIKPLDEATVLECAQQTRAIVTVEDHSVIGGLGSAVAEFLGENFPTAMRRIGVRDCFGDAGEFEWLVKKYGMDVDDIVNAVKELIQKKV